MDLRPASPLDADGAPRLTVFGVVTCEDTAITRARLDALDAPYVYVDLDAEPAADARVRLLNGGNRVTPTVVVGVEEVVVAEPDVATVDHLAELAWPGLPMEHPRLSAPAGPHDAPADALVAETGPVTPAGLVELPPGAAGRDARGEAGVPSRWVSGPGNRLALVQVAHEGCMACLGYSHQLLAHRSAFDQAGVGVAIVLRGDLVAAGEWRALVAPDARVLADPGPWTNRTLERLVTQPETPGSTIRFIAAGVVLLLLDGEGRVVRMAAGPEAGHLPSPAYLEDAVALEAVTIEAARSGSPDAAWGPDHGI